MRRFALLLLIVTTAGLLIGMSARETVFAQSTRTPNANERAATLLQEARRDLTANPRSYSDLLATAQSMQQTLDVMSGRVTRGLAATSTPRPGAAAATLRPSATLRASNTPRPSATPTGTSSFSRNVIFEFASVIDIDQWVGVTVVIVAVWLAGLALLTLAGRWLNARTITAIQRAVRSGARLQTPEDSLLIRAYSVIMVITAVFFYLSFAVLVLVVIVLALNINRVISLSVVGVILLGLTAYFLYHMFRAIYLGLFQPERRAKADVIDLTRADEPEIWRLADECAALMNVKPVTRILLGTNAGLRVGRVDSTWRTIPGGASDIGMVIGLATFSFLTENQIRALLCQAYALSGNAHQIRSYAVGNSLTGALLHLHAALKRGKYEQPFNPIFLFYLLISRVILDIASGMMRYWTLLADRAAADKVGALEVITALRHIIYARTLFDIQLQVHIELARRFNLPLQNLFTLPLTPELDTQARHIADQIMSKPTSKRDVDPSVEDRVAVLHDLINPEDHSDYGNALYLLAHPEQWQLKITAIIQAALNAQQRGIQPADVIRYSGN